jgi:hypothetical protein
MDLAYIGLLALLFAASAALVYGLEKLRGPR